MIYNLLLLFIGNLKIASTWVDWLTIKDCNNYLPTNLASEINSIGLHCRIVDSSLLSDWLTRSWLVQTLTKSAGSQVQICEWLIFPTLPLNYEQIGIFFFKQNLQNVSELRHALFMTKFTLDNFSFQDNYTDNEKYPLPWFRKYVSKLVFKPAKFQTNFFVVHQLSYEMKPCVNVLGFLVKHIIFW